MKKTVAVIFGGRSAEHDVSIITAHIPIITSLQTSADFDVWPIYIAKNGSWYCDKIMNDLEYFKNDTFESQLTKLKKVHFSLNQGLEVIWPGFRPKKLKFDVIFPAMHGTFGEDGSLMGLLRMANIPFVGCDLFASTIAMDKVLTKQILAAEKIPLVPYVWFTKSDWETNSAVCKTHIESLKYPLFVKPVHLGSSIGISKVKNELELVNAIEVAFHYDDKILVEEGVENLIEVTLPIMGNNTLSYGAIERPLNTTELFDFNDKYLSGDMKGKIGNRTYSEIPARIDEVFANNITNLGEKVYRIIGCTGIARIDFLIDTTKNTVYVNEINTLPGSLYCHNWRTIGISNMELVNKLITLAEEHFSAQQDLTYTFQSKILDKTRGGKFTM